MWAGKKFPSNACSSSQMYQYGSYLSIQKKIIKKHAIQLLNGCFRQYYCCGKNRSAFEN